MGCPFCCGGLAERDRMGHGGGGSKCQFLGDVLNGCSPSAKIIPCKFHSISRPGREMHPVSGWMYRRTYNQAHLVMCCGTIYISVSNRPTCCRCTHARYM